MTLVCISYAAEEGGILKMASPKLREFLADRPSATRALNAAISESFSKRTLKLHYFYSDDETQPRAAHFYPADSVVCIVIRENQQPCDEYLCLIYEVLNSQGEKRFQDLAEQAKSGAITKTNFVREIIRQEFEAVKKVKEQLDSLKLEKKEQKTSYFFKRFAECPGDFEGFFTYKPNGARRDPFKVYEELYDSLQKKP
jgi:hypothetical protein